MNQLVLKIEDVRCGPPYLFMMEFYIIEIVLVLFLLFADWKTIDSSSAAFSSIIFDHFLKCTETSWPSRKSR